jgi:hypothetical protein
MTNEQSGYAKDAKGRFVTGNIGGGRPKGARAKLGEEFLNALLNDFAEHGVVAVEAVRSEKPDQYLKVIASILPKEISGVDGAPIPITEIRLVGPDEG